MKYIFIILLSFFSFNSYSAVVHDVTFSSIPKIIKVGARYNSRQAIVDDFKDAIALGCIPLANTGWYWSGRYMEEINQAHAVYGEGHGSKHSDCSVAWSDSQIKIEFDSTTIEDNYCDTVMYQIDYNAAEKACINSANPETQNVTFTGSCDRENQVLVTQCEINDKPVTPPEPELCPDGSSPPCDDTGGGGDDGNIDLTGVIEAINNANETITGAVNDGHPAVNDLLSIQTEALSTSVESNRLLGVGIAALDVSNDALSNIANLTQDLNNKTESEVSQSIESNRLLGVGIAALDVSNDALSNIANLTQDLNNKTANEVSQSIESNRLLGIGNDELSNIAALTQGLNNTVTDSNNLLTGINANTDKTNDELSNINNTISSSSSNSSNAISKMLGTLIGENKDNNSALINKLDELSENSNKHDLDYENISAAANSADDMFEKNLDEYQNEIEKQTAIALIESNMKESVFDKVKVFFHDLIPTSSTCQNLSFGDLFTIDCAKFQKFRDIFGFFIYVYTALTLIDILFTGIVPVPTSSRYQ